MNSAAAAQIAGALGRDVANNIAPGVPISFTADGACPVDADAVVLISKGSAIALSVAAPGAGNVGRRITFLTTTNFAHVVTFTGTTLNDGTAGLNSTWTAAAVAGCSLTVIGVTAALWNVESFNLGVIAP